MMNHTLKNQYKVVPGTVIAGKWHLNKYVISRELGCGANGVVYLAKQGDTHVALKMSESSMSIASEVNVLKSFAKVQGSALGPSLLDVDDWQTGRGQISFYAMEYIEGADLLTFIKQKGKAWVSVLFLQLLKDLAQLHDNGWVFGDLKPENLIVTGPPPKIRCIDVGGTTVQGRAIKEFTEFYDRGYWGLGTRKADPGYDLFAVAMMIINTAYPKRFEKSTGGIAQLREAVAKQPELIPFQVLILKALQGQYMNARQMRADLLETMTVQNNRDLRFELKASASAGPQKAPVVKGQTGIPYSRQAYRKKRKRSGRLETVLISTVMTILLFLGMWYISTK